MFEFLKSLFKEKTEEQEVKLEHIENWLKEKTKPIFSELNKRIDTRLIEIKSQLSELKENINDLETAEVKNPEKIESRVKNIVLGHRANYLRILNRFLERINIPEPGHKKALEFCDLIEKELDSFGKASVKSYYTVQHLFSDQVAAIAKTLKNIGNNVKQIKQDIEDKDIFLIERAEKKIHELKDSIKKKQELEKKTEQAKKTSTELEENINRFEKKKTESEQGNEFVELNKEKQRITKTDEGLSSIKNRIMDLFSPLESCLKKFQRITLEHEKLIAGYARNPVDGLLNDKELKIIALLANMKKNIESGTLDLKDKKKEKAIEQIDTITKEILKQILDEYNELNKSKQEIEAKIKANKIISEIKDIETKLDYYIKKKEVLIKDIASLESSKEKIDIEKIKTELKESIRKAVDIDVVISS